MTTRSSPDYTARIAELEQRLSDCSESRLARRTIFIRYSVLFAALLLGMLAWGPLWWGYLVVLSFLLTVGVYLWMGR